MKLITAAILSHLAFTVPVFSAVARFDLVNGIAKRQGQSSSPSSAAPSSTNSTSSGSGSLGLPIEWDLNFAGAAFQDRQFYPTVISIYDDLAYQPITQGSTIVSREDYGLRLRLTKLYDSFPDLTAQDYSQAVLALMALSEALVAQGKFMECSGVATQFGVKAFNVTIETTSGNKRRDSSSYHGLQIRNLDSHTLNSNLTANLVNVTTTEITNPNSSMFRLLLSSAFGLMQPVLRNPDEMTTTYQITTGGTNAFLRVRAANDQLPKDDPASTFQAKHVLDALLYLTDYEIDQPYYRFVSALVSFGGTPEFYIELKGISEYHPTVFQPLNGGKRAIS